MIDNKTMLDKTRLILMLLFLATVPFLFYGFGRETLRIAAGAAIDDSRWTAFLTGAAIFIPCHFLAQRLIPRLWNYLGTLEHELTHLLVGLVFLKIPVRLRVSAHEGGEVRQIGLGTTGQTWISLAPYFFPTVSLAVVVAAYLVEIETRVLLATLGWTTAFHLVTNWSETSFRQPDLHKAGILKTLLILPLMNLICYGAVVAFVAAGRKGFIDFWGAGVRSAAQLAWEVWLKSFG